MFGESLGGEGREYQVLQEKIKLQKLNLN